MHDTKPSVPLEQAFRAFAPSWEKLDDKQKSELFQQFHLDGAFAGSHVAQIATETAAAFVAPSANWKEALQGVALGLMLVARVWHRTTTGNDLPEDARRVLSQFGEQMSASLSRSFEGSEGGVLAARMFVVAAMLASFGDALVKSESSLEVVNPAEGIILP